jgi:hypothetical protein
MTEHQLIEAAEKLGCAVIVGGGRYKEIEICAPNGFVFATTGTHSVVGEYTPFDKPVQVRAGMMEDISKGLKPCPHDCECRESIA